MGADRRRATGLEGGEEGSLRGDGDAGRVVVEIAERVEQRGVVLDVAALDSQRTLSGCGQHLVGLEDLGDRVEAVRAGRDLRWASTTASSSPSTTLRTRVSTLPRTGTTSRSGRSARSCAARRGEPVPTEAPAGSVATVPPSRATSTSRASSRGGTAARRRPSAGAVGRSLSEWTARSASPRSTASRTAETNTPTPPKDASGVVWSTSPRVLTSTSTTSRSSRSRSASATRPDCVRASRLARVATRTALTTCTPEEVVDARRRPRWRTTWRSELGRVGCGHRGDRLGVEVEQAVQRGGVAARRRGRRRAPSCARSAGAAASTPSAAWRARPRRARPR